jgi:hypothetical protein
MTTVGREDGVALLIAMIAMLLMSALGTALMLTSSSETLVAAHFRDSVDARYAAGALLERGVAELLTVENWSPLIAGLSRSPWTDGPPSGPRTLPDGSTLDLAQVVNLASCQKSIACAQADLEAITADRPWGSNNPRWSLYAYGPLRGLLGPGAIESRDYVLLLVANGPTPALLALRAEAFGTHGARAVVEATLGRRGRLDAGRDYNDDSEQGAVKVLSWREVR